MAKVTVYVNDDQLEKLKRVKKFKRGGVSRAFQHFIEEMSPGGSPSSYEYARKVMPVSAAIDRLSRRVARAVEAGGPPSDGGPVAAALTVLVHQEVLRRHPEAAAAVEKEFARFGLDEMVRLETEGIEDLLAEPAADPDGDDDVSDDEDDFDEDTPTAKIANLLGAEFREVASALREAGVLAGRGQAPRPPRPPRPPRGPGFSYAFSTAGPGSSRIEINIDASDDPRDVLSVSDFDAFTARHDDWNPDRDLTPEEVETVRDLLRARLERRDAAADGADEGEQG